MPASRFKIEKFTAPSHWASYLINGDASGMEADEKSACDRWLARINMGGPVDCEDAGFKGHYHDAWYETPLGADCQTYTFMVPKHKWTLRRIYLNTDGYTASGHYYGAGAPLYHAWCAHDGSDLCFRAKDRNAAKAHVLGVDAGAVFYS
jgi:hypothetical protein